LLVAITENPLDEEKKEEGMQKGMTLWKMMLAPAAEGAGVEAVGGVFVARAEGGVEEGSGGCRGGRSSREP